MNAETLSIARSLALCFLCTQAPAQASDAVTVWGILDASVARVDNGAGSVARLDSADYTASRIGFKGTEDLGGGLAAFFYLEHALQVDTGQAVGGTRFWNRGSYVGLRSMDLGQLTLGRQFVPIFWAFAWADQSGPIGLHSNGAIQAIERGSLVRVSTAALVQPLANGTLASAAGGVYSAPFSSAFENNLLIYKTPSFGGLTLSAAAGAGEANVDSAKVFGANAEYKGKGLFLGAGWNTKRGAVNGVGGGEQRVDESLLSGLYRLGNSIAIWGNVHGWKVGSRIGSVQGHDAMAGMAWLSGPHSLWLNYAGKLVGHCRQCNSSDGSIGYHYQLSKRSELYAFYSRVDNQANAAIALNGTNPAAPGLAVSSLGTGLLHSF